jgi:outer membrane lipopolysaccharide assembly protein LptE/RlpB
MNNLKKIIIVLIFSNLIQSCGFQLRKPVQLDYATYQIIGDQSAIALNLKKELSYSSMVESSSNAELIIEILTNDYQKRILSLAGRGQVAEFELIQQLTYRVKTEDGWTKPKRLEAIRDYTYDPALYNAARAEEELLRESMETQINRSIITEINNLSK